MGGPMQSVKELVSDAHSGMKTITADQAAPLLELSSDQNSLTNLCASEHGAGTYASD